MDFNIRILSISERNRATYGWYRLMWHLIRRNDISMPEWVDIVQLRNRVCR